MGKKNKDTTASPAKEAKAKTPANPITTKNFIHLLNILALLLAITAFVLQFFAVISHHWKWQKIDLHALLNLEHRPVQMHIFDDARIEQNYGLFARDIKVYGNNDQQLDITTCTRFPRPDSGEDDYGKCLSKATSFQSLLLTCSGRMGTSEACHCRRYPHWNAIIFFEVTALILLGLVVFVSALLSTEFSRLLKLIGAALSFLAFLFLLIGLILLLSYLKRETHTLADVYPHAYMKIANQVGRPWSNVAHKLVRREAQSTYRAYSLLPGQYPHNDTHFQQYSEQSRSWIYVPYTSLVNRPYEPRSQNAATQPTTTSAPLYNQYGPLAGYNEVFDHTSAWIGCSAVLSIFAMIFALLVPLLLAFSFLKGQQIGSEAKTITTTTVRTEYIAVPQDSVTETAPLTRSTVAEESRQEHTIIREEHA